MTNEKNVVFIGQKPMSVYTTSVVMASGNSNIVTIKGRGKYVGKAVDVSQLITRRFLKNWSITDVRLGTSEMETEDKRKIFVSTIEIQISKSE